MNSKNQSDNIIDRLKAREEAIEEARRLLELGYELPEKYRHLEQWVYQGKRERKKDHKRAMKLVKKFQKAVLKNET
jgi:hypothetical protein